MMWETLSTVPHCGIYGKPELALLHLGGAAVVWLAYMLIPLAITIVMVKRGLHFNFLASLFAAFIISCGVGHALYITASLYGWYWLEGIHMAITAAISLFTAGYAFWLIPKLLTMPTPDQHRRLVENIKRVVPAGWVEFYEGTNLPSPAMPAQHSPKYQTSDPCS
jgi:hypothetical protein